MNRMTKILCTAALGCAGVMICVSAHAAVTDSDKTFLTKASQGNFDEIKFSQLAENKTANPQVKKFAHLMIVQHTELGNKMMPFAQAWGLTPPTSLDADHQGEYDKLSGLSGADFDKTYMDDMVKDHQMTLDAFNQELSTTTDMKFKQAVMHGKSMVAAHLNYARSLDAKLPQ